NYVSQKARGQFLLFMQADLRVQDRQALAKVAQALQQPGVVATTFVQRGADAVFDQYDFWGQVFNARYLSAREESSFDTKFNGVRRAVFDQMGGYDDRHFGLGGEDIDFVARLRPYGKIVDTRVEVEHFHGLGKTYAPGAMLKKYCRNAEMMGATAAIF